MTSRTTDSGKRRLLVEQVKRLNETGQLTLPLSCDYVAFRGNSWTDRVTGTKYVRMLPALMKEENLGLSPQTLEIFESLVCNLGDSSPQFVIDFCESLVSAGGGFWFDKYVHGMSRSRKLATWICLDEKFGAVEHTNFGKDSVKAIGEKLETDTLHSPLRNFVRRIRCLREAARNNGTRPNYDPTANWSVANTQCSELLPQLSGLKPQLFKLLLSATSVQQQANFYLQSRFSHPIYWTPTLADRSSAIRNSAVKGVLHYARESLAMSAVVLAVYACSLSGTEDDVIAKREGYIFGESLNCLAMAHALRVISGADDGDGPRDFDVIASPEFERGYIEAYAAIGEKFKEILLAI